MDRSNRDLTAVVEVLEAWKGPRLPQLVTVNGGPENLNQQTSVDRTFLLGQAYLVLPANDRQPFQDSLCTGTQLWSTPTGEVPEHLQDAVGGAQPIPLLSDQGSTDEGSVDPGGVNNLVVAMIVVGLAFIIVFASRRVGRGKTSSSRRNPTREPAGQGVSPSIVRRRKRSGRKRSTSSPVRAEGPSRLDQVRKGSGEHERKQLERAVKLTVMTPPSRRNHYTSGRRSAP